MTQRTKIIMGLTVLAVLLALFAIQFRYTTASREGSPLIKFDRWTGAVQLCDWNGCYTDSELRAWREEKNRREAQSQGQMSDAELADLLGKKGKFDVDGARKAGHSDRDIIEHIAKALP